MLIRNVLFFWKMVKLGNYCCIGWVGTVMDFVLNLNSIIIYWKTILREDGLFFDNLQDNLVIVLIMI